MRTLSHLLKEKDTRMKFLYTVLVLLLVRFLGSVPVYGIDAAYLQFLFQDSNALDFIDLMSGGSMAQLSIAAFGISSYISASILLQLMQVLFPKLEKMGREGTIGRKRIERITFTVALVITAISGFGICRTYGSAGLMDHYDKLHILLAVGSWLLGSTVILFLTLRINEHGIGNGISLLLTFNILTRIPSSALAYYENVAGGKTIFKGILAIAAMAAFIYLFYMIAIVLQKGVIKVPIRQFKKAESILNSEAFLPVNVNIANVMPVIYAATLVSFPQTLCTILGFHPTGYVLKLINTLDTSNWFTFEKWYYPFGLLFYLFALFVFGFFSSEMNFCSEEVADNMKKSGDLIPGINPGTDTVDYLEKRRKQMSILNVVFLIVLTLVPDFVCARIGFTQFTFLGTSLIIVINTLYDTALRFHAAAIHKEKRYCLFL